MSAPHAASTIVFRSASQAVGAPIAATANQREFWSQCVPNSNKVDAPLAPRRSLSLRSTLAFALGSMFRCHAGAPE